MEQYANAKYLLLSTIAEEYEAQRLDLGKDCSTVVEHMLCMKEAYRSVPTIAI